MNRQYIKRAKISSYKIIFLLSVLLIASIMFNMEIEDSKRIQARYNLNNITYCFSELEARGMPFNEYSTICTKKSKTSFTGDVYVLDSTTKEFVSETSRDVPRKALYFTKDSVGKLFYDWNSGKEALYYILSGKDSEEGLNVSYNFDGSPEWLEWKNYDDKYVVVQGIQKDEVMDRFKPLQFFIYMSVLLVIVFIVSTSKRQRRCDERK